MGDFYAHQNTLASRIDDRITRRVGGVEGFDSITTRDRVKWMDKRRDASRRRGEEGADAEASLTGVDRASMDAASLTSAAALESAIDALERESAALDARERATARALARAELEREAEDALGARLELELEECRRVMATMRRDRAARELERRTRELVERSRTRSAERETSAADDAAARARRLAEIDRGFARERARAKAFRKSLEDTSS